MTIHPIATELLTAFEQSLSLNGRKPADGNLYAGVDLGTAYIVTAVVDAADQAGLSRKVARLEPLVCVKG